MTPGTQAANDPNPVELGVRFTSRRGRQPSLLPLLQEQHQYRHAHRQPVDEHGTMLATTLQQRDRLRLAAAEPRYTGCHFANTIYVVSYHTDAGNYADDQGYFGSAAL